MMLVFEPYNGNGCIYHCSGGALPIDGEADRVDGLELLWPREWRPCPACTVGLNPDLTCDPAAVERAVPVFERIGSSYL